MKDYIVKSLDRIEWVANDILEQKELLDFDEFSRRYEANVRTMIKREGSYCAQVNHCIYNRA